MAQDRLKFFGIDLLLTGRAGGYDLAPDYQGDIALTQSTDNISQALTLRILVRRGELTRLGWPDFGSRVHELIGEPNNLRTRTRLMAFARNAIEGDPRVVEVTSIKAEPTERSLVRLEMDIQLISEPSPLNLVVDIDLEAL
jgi:phage baseplate assembly protein W